MTTQSNVFEIAVDLEDPAVVRLLNLVMRCAESDASAVLAAQENDFTKFHAAMREERDALTALEMAGRMAVVAIARRLVAGINQPRDGGNEA